MSNFKFITKRLSNGRIQVIKDYGNEVLKHFGVYDNIREANKIINKYK